MRDHGDRTFIQVLAKLRGRSAGLGDRAGASALPRRQKPDFPDFRWIEAAGLAADDRGRNRRTRQAPADGVDARRRDCVDAPAIVPLHGVGRGAEAKLAR
jgi:hypothetical protein